MIKRGLHNIIKYYSNHTGLSPYDVVDCFIRGLMLVALFIVMYLLLIQVFKVMIAMLYI